MKLYYKMNPRSLIKAALTQQLYKDECIEREEVESDKLTGLFSAFNNEEIGADIEKISLEELLELYSKEYRKISWLPKSKGLSQLEKMLYYAIRHKDKDNSLIFTTINQAIEQGIGIVLGKLTPESDKIYRKARQVWAEVHRVKGFIRFWPVKNQPNTMVGRAEFEHKIEDIVMRYFGRRYQNQRIILLKGKEAILLVSGKIKVYPQEKLNLQFDEHDFDQLWDTYYDCQTISGRMNKKLARKHIPQKLWSWVPEGEKLR